MLSSVLQKSLRYGHRVLRFLMTACATPFRRRCSNRSVVLPLFRTNMFLVMFWSEAAFYSRRTNTVVAFSFAAIRLADYEGWQHLPLQ